MIFDSTKNVRRYKEDERFEKAFEFIENTDLSSIDTGKYEISGNDVFALIQEYETLPAEGKYMEAHHKFADIQLIIDGVETIYFSGSSDGMDLFQEYSDEKDCVLYSSDGPDTKLCMKQGDFAVFYPCELHKPGCCFKEKSVVKKAVIKVRID